MKKVVIDGRCIRAEKFNGAQRYATEILLEMDKIVEKGRYELLVETKYRNLVKLKNIKVIGNKGNNAISWYFWVFMHLFKNGHACYVHFSNGLAVWKNSIITIHDIYAFYDVYNNTKKYYIKKKVKIILNVLFAKKIVTVSEYSKQTMIEKLPIKPEKIEVIGNGWQHIKAIQSDDKILERWKLRNRQYYFFVGRLVKNKNIKWIFEIANRNPQSLFVISGDLSDETFEYYAGENKNIIYTGFISEGEMKSLYQHCKAFLFPSLMEGFGIPPMEALYNGASIIIANTSSLPEIYGRSAHYIDPYKYDYCLEELLEEPVTLPDIVLNKYSWKKSAWKWKKIIEENIG